MAEIQTIVILTTHSEVIYDDGVTLSIPSITSPKGVDTIVYPDWFGKTGVRCEINSGDKKKYSVTHDSYSDHKGLIESVKAAAVLARDIFDNSKTET